MRLERTKTVEVTSTVELKPCPFCGSDDLAAKDIFTGNGADSFSGRAYANCNHCGAYMEVSSYNIGYGDTLEKLFAEVVAKWNRRA